jgi:hypothetical protein
MAEKQSEERNTKRDKMYRMSLEIIKRSANGAKTDISKILEEEDEDLMGGAQNLADAIALGASNS